MESKVVEMQITNDKNEYRQRTFIQAAHDIRSPLGALNIIMSKYLLEMSAESQVLAASAIERINRIADDILTSAKDCRFPDADESCNLADSIGLIIAEKEICNPSVEFFGERKTYDLNLRAKIYAISFERILSNIIDNACEAMMHERGKVEIRVIRFSDQFAVEIKDNGIGMTTEQLSRLGKRGKTSKSSGCGLALNDAILRINSIGGHFSITSRSGQGTNVRIFIPSCELT